MKAVDIFLSKRQLTVAQLLLVAKADLAGIVDLRPDTGKLVQFVLAADAERRLVLGGGPTEVDTSLQTGVHLLVNRATENLAVVDVGVNGEVSARVAQSKVVLRQLRLARVECKLVTQKPALVSDGCSGIDERSAEVAVNISTQRDALVLVFRLKDTGLGSKTTKHLS